MDGTEKDTRVPAQDLRATVREVIQEFIASEHSRAEPAYKAELVEERKRREQLEAKLNVLVEENRRAKQVAEELDRSTALRTELQRLGVAKVDLAFKAIKDEIFRREDGKLVARSAQGEIDAKEYLAQFVSENPELLPARISGGSGAGAPRFGNPLGEAPVDLERIRPGMSEEERERVRQEIARVASQIIKGQ